MDKALVELFKNIQGMDAAIVVMCVLIYRTIAKSKKGDEADALLGIRAMMYIAMLLITARTIITLAQMFI